MPAIGMFGEMIASQISLATSAMSRRTGAPPLLGPIAESKPEHFLTPPGAVRAVVAALLPVGVWAIQQMLARVLGK